MIDAFHHNSALVVGAEVHTHAHHIRTPTRFAASYRPLVSVLSVIPRVPHGVDHVGGNDEASTLFLTVHGGAFTMQETHLCSFLPTVVRVLLSLREEADSP